MSKDINSFYEDQFYQYLDELKFLFFPDKWDTNLLDYSKNELLAIMFIYRQGNVNMSEIAEYLGAPLNTVSGVINRLEKKTIVQRIRDAKDKRIVNISLTEEGINLFNTEKKEIIFYFQKIYNSLSEEEIATVMSVFTKVMKVLKEGTGKESIEEKKVKRIKKIVIE